MDVICRKEAVKNFQIADCINNHLSGWQALSFSGKKDNLLLITANSGFA